MLFCKASYISILFWLKSMGVTPNKTTMFRFYLWMGCILSWIIILITGTYQFLLYVIILTIPIWLLDKVDGDLARHTDQMTNEGKVLDPFIDKIKVYSGFFVLSFDLPKFIWFFMILLLFLDLVSNNMRKYQNPNFTGANQWGKFKLAFQVCSLLTLAIHIFLNKTMLDLHFFDLIFLFLGVMSLVIATICATISVVIRLKQIKGN